MEGKQYVNGSRPRLGLIGGLALTLGLTSTAVFTSTAAVAAPFHDRPPSVQIGWTDAATPTTAHEYDANNKTDLPIGTWPDEQGAVHTTRVYATFDLSAFEGKKIYGGLAFFQETGVTDCAKRSIEIWRTKAISATPTWKRAPTELAKLDDTQTPDICPATISFDVGSALVDAQARKQRLVTFEIRVAAEHESDPSYARKLYWYGSVALTVQYDSPPQIDNSVLYNQGLPCTQLKPYPRINGGLLQARGSDPDAWDTPATEFAVWPTAHSTARTTYTNPNGISGRANGFTIPSAALVDGKSYGWQARVSDGVETSAWSKKCYFTYDASRPSTPNVTSSNYPAYSTGQPVPVGEPGLFTFSGHGDKDIAGFQYSWNELGVNGCSNSGAYGQLVCPDRLSGPGTVRANAPGGTATVALSPPRAGPALLRVRSIDVAGNSSDTVTYQMYIPPSEPRITVLSGTPLWNKEVVLKISPAPGVSEVTEYDITAPTGDHDTRRVDADGTADYRFFATDVNGGEVKVRSHSANGFVSTEASYRYRFDPWPGVVSDVYDSNAEIPVGGVGVQGSFTFTPPAGWTDVAKYRYSFDDDGSEIDVPAMADGSARITWTPSASGYVTLTVYAVRPNGTLSPYANWYSFEVAETS